MIRSPITTSVTCPRFPPATRAGLAAELPALKVPVDLVWGLEDPFQPWDPVGRCLQASLPSARVTLQGGCGQFIPLECPERLCAALLDAQA